MLKDWLTIRVNATPQALALIIGEERWTYADLDGLVELCAARLQAQGVGPGQNVAVLMSNNLPYVCLIHALARLGAVLVPLNTRLTARELSWQLNYTDCAWLLYLDEMGEKVEALEHGGTSISVSGWLQAQGQANSAFCDPLSSPVELTELDLNALQAIVFTSGTTGFPKGAMLTFANHFWGATASSFRLGLQTDDRWLSCLPLYHVGGLAVIFRSCLYGTAVVLHERFDMDAFNQSLDRDQITLTSLVPTMLHRLLAERQDRGWPSSLRLVLLGGAATTPELVARCQEIGLPIAITYGLTESASQVATMRPEDVVDKPGCVGKPLLFSSVRIVGDGDDKRGHTLGPGELGEIVVSGPTVMAGYYKNPDATAKTLRNGELYTGDIGYLDVDGDLWLVQRRSDIIISGGENIYPTEVESILCQHPAVSNACVVGMPDPEWGERVVAMVTLHVDSVLHVDSSAEGLLDEDELIAFSRRYLAGYKQPKAVVFVDMLPQTASGKIERRSVVEQLHLIDA